MRSLAQRMRRQPPDHFFWGFGGPALLVAVFLGIVGAPLVVFLFVIGGSALIIAVFLFLLAPRPEPQPVASASASANSTAPEALAMPVFAIKAKDDLALDTVRHYAELCRSAGLVDHAAEVEKAIEEIEEWRAANPELCAPPYHEHAAAGSPGSGSER